MEGNADGMEGNGGDWRGKGGGAHRRQLGWKGMEAGRRLQLGWMGMEAAAAAAMAGEWRGWSEARVLGMNGGVLV